MKSAARQSSPERRSNHAAIQFMSPLSNVRLVVADRHRASSARRSAAAPRQDRSRSPRPGTRSGRDFRHDAAWRSRSAKALGGNRTVAVNEIKSIVFADEPSGADPGPAQRRQRRLRQRPASARTRSTSSSCSAISSSRTSSFTRPIVPLSWPSAASGEIADAGRQAQHVRPPLSARISIIWKRSKRWATC